MTTDQTATPRPDLRQWTRPGEFSGDLMCLHCDDLVGLTWVPYHLWSKHAYQLVAPAAPDAKVAAAEDAAYRKGVKDSIGEVTDYEDFLGRINPAFMQALGFGMDMKSARTLCDLIAKEMQRLLTPEAQS